MKHDYTAAIVLVCAAALAASCAKYNVTREIKHSSELSKCKKSGIIFRLPAGSPISYERHRRSLSQWLEGYKRVNDLVVLENPGKTLTVTRNEFDRFNQRSGDDDFLYFKSFGIITQYLNANKEQIDALMENAALDSLIIYEVEPALSAEMQYTAFSSVLVIINAERRIIYLDHQFNDYATNEYSPAIMKNRLLDDINGRFLDLMFKLKYIKEP